MEYKYICIYIFCHLTVTKMGQVVEIHPHDRHGPVYIANTRGPFYEHGLTLIPVWMNNYVHCKMLVQITYPFSNLNGATVEI